MTKTIVIYTDGGAIGNGKHDSVCGWAYEIIKDSVRENGTHAFGSVEHKYGATIGATNNQMEMFAVLQALRSLTKEEEDIPIILRSDSKYVVETLTGNFTVKKNEELWELLFKEIKRFKSITIEWVRGHAKDIHNIAVDMLVKEAMENIKGGVTNENVSDKD